MTFDELKEVILKRPENIYDQMYNYGYECGKKNIINFEILQQAFYIYNCTVKQRLFYLRKILEGFQEGSKADRKLI